MKNCLYLAIPMQAGGGYGYPPPDARYYVSGPPHEINIYIYYPVLYVPIGFTWNTGVRVHPFYKYNYGIRVSLLLSTMKV